MNAHDIVAWRTPIRAVSRRLSELLQRFQPSETALLLITAIAIGAATGLAAVLFIKLIEAIAHLSFSVAPTRWPIFGRGWFVLAPVLGALVAGPIISRFAREAKGHGVPEVMQALVQEGGRIRPRVALAKIAASSLCIGTGGSAGREGPIVQVGSTLGSMLGQLFRMSDARIRNLVACGAAAGVAATFNAPIAGVAFAIEVLIGDLGLGLVSNVVISAVTASVVSQAFLGDNPAFPVPTYRLDAPVELLFYVVLGLLAAVVAVVFIRVLYASEDLFDAWGSVPMWLKPAIGALLLGLLALTYPYLLVSLGVEPGMASLGFPLAQHLPHVFGSGFPTIEAALNGPLPWILVGTLIILKMAATALTLGSGNSGGVFAPSLFMGAMLGGFFGIAAGAIFPGVAPHPGACALAGMAAVFAGSARAPLTAMLIAFEMSGDYAVILPLMITTITATLIAQRINPESIYSLKLARRGIRLRHGRDVDVLDSVLVGDVMQRDPATVTQTMTLGDFQRFLLTSHSHGAVVLDDDTKLIGLATLQDLERAMKQGEDWQAVPVGAVMTRTLLLAHPEEPIGTAMQRLAVRDVGRMPVVDRDDPKRLLGVIRRADMARAYQRGVLRRTENEDRENQQRISRHGGTQLVELRVHPGSPAAGTRVKDLALPEEVLLTTRLHGTRRQLLHGSDVLEEGDVVLALADPEQAAELRTLFAGR